MKTRLSIAGVLILALMGRLAHAQEIQTLLGGTRVTGGYGALSNKFTTINGEYANMAGIYGGVYINDKFMIGMGAAATTNNLRVPDQYNMVPGTDMSYEVGQIGVMTEYVLASDKAVHLAFNMLTGAGFTLQYVRHWNDGGGYWGDDLHDEVHDENWFFMIEPGVQVEVNVFKWMRLSPGISYRKTFGSDARGLDDDDLSDMSYNVTLKFGKF